MALFTSENTIPSSPISTEPPIFSSEPTGCSSPPSSPPEFQWQTDKPEERKHPAPSSKPGVTTAFSLLGKRKALGDLNHNAQPAKKRAASVQLAPRRIDRANEKSLTQTQLSLGQPIQKKCQTCGMEFVPSSEEDRTLHKQHHTNVTQGYHMGKSLKPKDWVCFETGRPGDTILAIDHSRPTPQRRRAKEVLEIVERELGAVEIGSDELWATMSSTSGRNGRFTNYLYMRGGRCIAYLLMERISKAYPVMASEDKSKDASVAGKVIESTNTTSTSALTALKARRQAFSQALKSNQPIQLSKNHVSAAIGVSRIWTLPKYRSHDIATSLLDSATAHLLGRVTTSDEPGGNWVKCVSPDETGYRVLTANEKVARVAFSQPTQAGARLARRWFGKLYGWMVYAN